MAFCSKCGKQVKEGAKFCSGCGNAMEQVAGAFGGVTSEQMKENIKTEMENSILSEIHAGYKEKQTPNIPQTVEKPKKKILLIAFILGIIIGGYYLAAFGWNIIHAIQYDPTIEGAIIYYDDGGNMVENMNDDAIIFSLLFIVFLTIVPASIFCISGRRNNDKKKILIAAILYPFSFNIPSSILCFIAYAQMKKAETIISQ